MLDGTQNGSLSSQMHGKQFDIKLSEHIITLHFLLLSVPYCCSPHAELDNLVTQHECVCSFCHKNPKLTFSFLTGAVDFQGSQEWSCGRNCFGHLGLVCRAATPDGTTTISIPTHITSFTTQAAVRWPSVQRITAQELLLGHWTRCPELPTIQAATAAEQQQQIIDQTRSAQQSGVLQDVLSSLAAN